MQGTAVITAHRQNLRAITVGYRAALAATAALCLASTVFNYVQIGRHNAQAEILVSAERQSLQSERILSNLQFAIDSAPNSPSREKSIQTVLQTLSEWRLDQKKLADYVTREKSKDLLAAVDQATPFRQVLERVARAFVTSGGKLDVPFSQVVDTQHRFTVKQEKVAQDLKAEYARETALLQILQAASGILLLIFLAMQGYLLFSPLVARGRRSLKALEEQASHLQSMQGELLVQNASLHESRTALSQAVTRAEDMAKLSRFVASRFEELFNGLPIATCTFDFEGVIFEWNREAETLTGISSALALGKSIFDVLGMSDHIEEHRRMVSGIFEGDHLYNIERKIVRPNGAVRHTLLNAFPLRDPDGKINGAVCSMIDVTERIASQERLHVLLEQRQEYEEALSLANEEMKLAQAIAHVGSWQSSVDFSDVYWSPEMYLALGVKPEDGPPTFTDFLSFIHPEDVEEFHRLAVDAAIEGREWQVEHRIVRTGGEERIVVSTIQPWLDRGRVIGTLMDVTHARKEARRVAESETLFRTSMNAIQAGVIFMNAEGQIKKANPKAAEILELDEDQLLGLKPILLDRYCIREDGTELSPSEYPLAIAYRERRVVDAAIYAIKRSDGTLVWLNVNAAPLLIENQYEPIGAVSSFTDITDLREKQELLLAEMARTNEQALILEMQKIELEAVNEKLQDLASLDGLTGLKNHRSFQEFYEHQYAIARRTKVALSVLLLDVDRFKTFNDEFGHQAGDEVLRGVARALHSAARESDYVARYGGEEFVVVLPGTDAEGAVLAAERFRKVIESQQWPNRQVTASIGVATLHPSTQSREQLIAMADNALYRSKDNGRNRTTHADDLAPAA